MGCYIGHINYGQCGYADDVQMLSPTVTGLQKMVNVSEEFGREYDVSFNAKKTVCMCFGDQMLFKQLRHIMLNGAKISWDTSAKHLGNILSTPQNDTCDINVKMGQFIANVNKLNAQFANVPIKIKIDLLQSYCASWYGCQTWALNTPQTDKLNIEWNKAIRRTLGLPHTTRTKLLPLLAGQNNFHWQHASRWLKMFQTMLFSTNLHVKYLAHRSLSSVTGNMGKNVVRLKSSPGWEIFLMILLMNVLLLMRTNNELTR